MNRLPEVIIKIIVEFASEKFEFKDDNNDRLGFRLEYNCKNFKDTSLSMYGFSRLYWSGSQVFTWFYARNCLIHRFIKKVHKDDTFNHLSDDKHQLKLFRSPKNQVIRLTIFKNDVKWLYDQDLYNLLISL
jgi:hypothetical protein